MVQHSAYRLGESQTLIRLTPQEDSARASSRVRSMPRGLTLTSMRVLTGRPPG
ncbi:hypothetical protein [Nocardioides convexus]|uniref:hypothetical protein n=1 Tax=Nocardioides convexus TaxID=2712224 RepID=UPI00241816A9|nr:hypothetical protein [Nocardioides convexus]